MGQRTRQVSLRIGARKLFGTYWFHRMATQLQRSQSTGLVGFGGPRRWASSKPHRSLDLWKRKFKKLGRNWTLTNCASSPSVSGFVAQLMEDVLRHNVAFVQHECLYINLLILFELLQNSFSTCHFLCYCIFVPPCTICDELHFIQGKS